jgi:hypothetical protein
MMVERRAVNWVTMALRRVDYLVALMVADLVEKMV